MVEQRSPKRRRVIDPSEKATPSRPSYGAPTRASLSRYNPNLLPDARSSPTRKSPGKDKPSAKHDDLLSHVLGPKTRRTTRQSLEQATTQQEIEPARTTGRPKKKEDLPASEPDHSGSEGVAVEADGNEVEESSEAEFQTPTIEGGRFRDEDDGLPETPQHLRERPEYQDKPPRGVLYHSAKKARLKSGRLSRQTSSQPRAAETTEVDNTEAGAEKRLAPQLSLEEQNQLTQKKEELDRLQNELRKIKNDTLQLEQHASAIERLKDGQDYDKLFNVVALINRMNPTEEPEDSEVNLLSVSTLLTSYLPFSIPLPESSSSSLSSRGDDTPVLSHAPLPNTPKLLNLFTPFKLTSVLSPPSKPSKLQPRVEQLHTITLSLSSLFSCNLALTVSSDQTTERQPVVSSLKIPHLSPWADREVGSWARSLAADGDVQGLGYGLGRYWELNIKRAQVWTMVVNEYAHLRPRIIGVLSSIDQGQSSPPKKATKKRKRDDDDELDGDQLGQYLGRDMLVCGNQSCEMRIRWHLGFDWTSEIESKVSLKLTFARRGRISPTII